MNRRSFMQAILAAGAAPYVVTTAGVLMPVRSLAVVERPIYCHLRLRNGAGRVIRERSYDGELWIPDSGHDGFVTDVVKLLGARIETDGGGMIITVIP